MKIEYDGELLTTDYDKIVWVGGILTIHMHWNINGSITYYLHIENPKYPEQILIITGRQKDWLIRLKSLSYWQSTNLTYEEKEYRYNKLIYEIYNSPLNEPIPKTYIPF